MRTFHFYGFRDLQNYTTLKLAIAVYRINLCFRDLQNYTTLKPFATRLDDVGGFRDLQNYTTLKRWWIAI